MFDPEETIRRVEIEAARRLLAAAITLQTDHRQDLSIGNPAPHKNPAPKGEFPRLRTGGGRAGVQFSPSTVEEVRQRRAVAVGFRPGAMHLLFLGGKGWKWLVTTYERVKPKIDRILHGGSA